jgi:hypothetical protein
MLLCTNDTNGLLCCFVQMTPRCCYVTLYKWHQGVVYILTYQLLSIHIPNLINSYLRLFLSYQAFKNYFIKYHFFMAEIQTFVNYMKFTLKMNHSDVWNLLYFLLLKLLTFFLLMHVKLDIPCNHLKPLWWSDWLLFTAKWEILQQYHCENKLHSLEMIMMSALY